MAKKSEPPEAISIALTGSGGLGVVTTGQVLLDSAARAGWYGLMTRSSGAQIRGGESVAFLRLGSHPIRSHGNYYDIMVSYDWVNFERFAAEIPLIKSSVVLCDPASGDVPEVVLASGARIIEVPLKEAIKGISGGRSNMVGLGALASIIAMPEEALAATLEKNFKRRGDEVVHANKLSEQAGRNLGQKLDASFPLNKPEDALKAARWGISGNEAAGLGALRAGVRFAAAYPITPSTDMLEWLAPNIEKMGGALIQAEDELASINMIIGGSYGGAPALTATSGPGLALMMESIGLAVAAEIPILIYNVMRGGPSTGIPTKSEQSDLNIALYGLHGDAPHLVTAANSVDDCLFTTQWSMHLSEALQCPIIVLSDQALAQARVIVDHPAEYGFTAKREMAAHGVEDYQRYKLTESGVSPMSIPGVPGGEYVAEGLEHNQGGTPSAQADHHLEQLEKRHRKLAEYDFGSQWADITGEGDTAILTWGSPTEPAREARKNLLATGVKTRLISIRLLSPPQIDQLHQALKGVKRILVVEQTHSKQFYRYLRAHYELPGDVKVFAQPGPLPVRPGQIFERIVNWKDN